MTLTFKEYTPLSQQNEILKSECHPKRCVAAWDNCHSIKDIKCQRKLEVPQLAAQPMLILCFNIENTHEYMVYGPYGSNFPS